MISDENGVFQRTNDSVAGYENAEKLEDEAMATLMKYFSGTLNLTGTGIGDSTGTTTVNQAILEAWVKEMIEKWCAS